MDTAEEFRKYGHLLVDWMADYYKNIESYPVKPKVKPGAIMDQIPDNPPEMGEPMEAIISDFNSVIMPGVTHWQSPNFFAYFPANASYPSLLAEMLTAALASQCMIWDTSPAAAELEEQMMNWLKSMTGLPPHWHGVIQDGASNATLTALLTAREEASKSMINENGFDPEVTFRVYCSTEAHSSVEKSVKIAGIGRKNLVKVPVNEEMALRPDLLDNAIQKDIADGYTPLAVVAAIGTTGTTAVDSISELSAITQKHQLWLHIDAAFAGTALLLPEYRWMIRGIELADSFVFNPHKWMFTHFDCSAYYVKDKMALINTFEILPEYLKTVSRGQVNDYRDWGIPMGRRFRALKLWFVIRSYGTSGLQNKIRNHIRLAEDLENRVIKDKDFEMMAPRNLNLVCFRYNPGNMDAKEVDRLNEKLEQGLNDSGKMYLTHTRVNGKYTLRMVIAQTHVSEKNVTNAWKLIKEKANSL